MFANCLSASQSLSLFLFFFLSFFLYERLVVWLVGGLMARFCCRFSFVVVAVDVFSLRFLFFLSVLFLSFFVFSPVTFFRYLLCPDVKPFLPTRHGSTIMLINIKCFYDSRISFI